MKTRFGSALVTALLFAALVAGSTLGGGAAAASGPTYNYFPTAAEEDGRFLAIAGGSSGTFAGATVSIGLTAPLLGGQIRLGIFDGDTGSYTNGLGLTVTGSPSLGYWDEGTTPLEYSLYADPNGDGSGTCLVGRWLGNGGNGTCNGGLNLAPMPDNDWYEVCFYPDLAALNLNGRYYYVLRVRNVNPTALAVSSFKLRSTATIVVLPQTLSLYCPLSFVQELNVLSPPGQPSRYDGTWNLSLALPENATSLEIWDGDGDTGNAAGLVPQTFDDDDPDTPATIPSWAAGTSAVPEGVALSDAGVTGKGSPPDDSASAYYRREAGLSYDVFHTANGTDPDGNVYRCLNPSGNREWERFRISNNAADTRTEADYAPNVAADGATYVPAGPLPAGTWRVTIRGLDAGNLNTYRFPFPLVGTLLDGLPVVNSVQLP